MLLSTEIAKHFGEHGSGFTTGAAVYIRFEKSHCFKAAILSEVFEQLQYGYSKRILCSIGHHVRKAIKSPQHWELCRILSSEIQFIAQLIVNVPSTIRKGQD